MADTLEQIVQRMIDAGESEDNIASVIKEYKAEPAKPTGPVDGGPEDYWSGFLHGGWQGIKDAAGAELAGAKGFVKGIIPGVGEGAMGMVTLPISILKEVIATTKGAGNLVDDPIGTLTEAWNNVKSIPGQARDAVKAALELAKNDPEEWGRQVGKITGNLGVGVAAAKAVPMLPKPLAEKVGTAAETFGKKASWPLRITGAHQIIGGNVLGGIATMTTPELLESGGTKVRQWGESGPVTTRLVKDGDVIATAKKPSQSRATRLSPDQQAGIRTSIAKNLDTSLEKLGNPAADGLKDLDTAIAAEKKNAQGIRIASAKRETAMQALEEKADQTHQAAKVKSETATDVEQQRLLDEFQKRQATATADISKSLGRSLDQAGNPAAAGLEDLDAAIADESTAGAARRKASAQREADLRAEAQIEEGSKGLVPGPPKITKTVKAPGQTMTTTMVEPEAAAGAGGGGSIEYQALKSQYGQAVADNWLKRQGVRPTAAEPTGAIESLGRDLPAAPPEQAPPLVPASKSSRAQSSVPGISAQDLEALKQILAENPQLTAEEAAQELVKQRGQRQVGYQDEARLGKLEQASLDRDQE